MADPPNTTPPDRAVRIGECWLLCSEVIAILPARRSRSIIYLRGGRKCIVDSHPDDVALIIWGWGDSSTPH